MAIRVLFMQSQAYLGADSAIHARLMRHFDRAAVELYAACAAPPRNASGVTAMATLRAIPDLRIRQTDFGPTVFGASVGEKLKRSLGAPLAAADLLALAAYIRRHKIEIIHGTEKPRDAFYGVLLGKLTGAKSLVHVHVKYESWLKPTVKWALRHADAVVGISRYVAQTLVDGGLPPERVFAVGNSLDHLERWDPALDGQPVRRSLGVPDGAPVLAIIARLFSWKGQGDLLEATAILRHEFPELRVLIVGEDDPGAHPGGGSYRAELEAQARRLGIERNVVFTGHRDDVAGLLAATDVFTMPSWEEPWGMVFMEAMAMGKPVVAWNNGGAPEVVVDGETGLLIEPKNIPALAEGIRTLLRDPELRRRLGAAGRRRVEQTLTPQRMCREMVEVYRQTLAAHRSPRRDALPTPS